MWLFPSIIEFAPISHINVLYCASKLLLNISRYISSLSNWLFVLILLTFLHCCAISERKKMIFRNDYLAVFSCFGILPIRRCHRPNIIHRRFQADSVFFFCFIDFFARLLYLQYKVAHVYSQFPQSNEINQKRSENRINDVTRLIRSCSNDVQSSV